MRGAIAPNGRGLIGECVGLGAAAACHVGTHGPDLIGNGMQRGVALADAALEVGRTCLDRLRRVAAVGIDLDELGSLSFQLLRERGAVADTGGHGRGGKHHGGKEDDGRCEGFHDFAFF